MSYPATAWSQTSTSGPCGRRRDARTRAGFPVAHGNTHSRDERSALRSGKLYIFSPISGLSDAAKTSLADIGEVAFFAPNGYHNGLG